MTVVYLDSCHLCGEPVAGGVFCRRCLAYAADTVNQLPAVAAGAPTDRGRPAAPAGSWDGAPTGAAGSSAPSSGKSSARTSGTERVAPVVPLNENTRRSRGLQAAPTGA